MKFAWIDTQCRQFPLAALCEVLCVSVNGYRAWKRGGTPERQRLTDAQLLTLIRTIHAEVKGAYGSPRMTEEVRSRGLPASKARVERLMSANGIRARHKRRYRVTTDSRHKLPVAPNVLNRNITPVEPNQVFTSDITYIWTDELGSHVSLRKRGPRRTVRASFPRIRLEHSMKRRTDAGLAHCTSPSQASHC